MQSASEAQSFATWTLVARVDSVSEGETLALNVEGRKLALYHLDDGTFAVTNNVCTHEFALLTDGWLEGCEIECPLHAGRFDVRTGKALCAPVEKDIPTYPVEVRDGDVFVLLPKAT